MKILIRDAEALCKKVDAQAIVILSVTRSGAVQIVTYGESKKKCAAIGRWARELGEHALSVVPFRTIFGWGNEGIPKPLTEEEMATLSPAGRSYAEKYS